MRLIEEYLSRQADDYLVMPCCVCLHKTNSGEAVVMTLTTVYGNRDQINVRFFTVEEEPSLIKEKTVDRNKIFDPEVMDGKEFNIIKFNYSEFPEGAPTGDALEEIELKYFYENLYYGSFHKDERMMFLRTALLKGTLKSKDRKSLDKIISKLVEKFYFYTPMFVAPEILFINTFPRKELKFGPIDYQKMYDIMNSSYLFNQLFLQHG